MGVCALKIKKCQKKIAKYTKKLEKYLDLLAELTADKGMTLVFRDVTEIRV